MPIMLRIWLWIYCCWIIQEYWFVSGSASTTFVVENDEYDLWWEEYSGIFRVLGIFILSLLALYRREMSSNRMYHVNDEPKTKVEENDGSCSTNDEIFRDQLLDHFLEGAGRVCSGGPVSAMMMALVQSISKKEQRDEETTIQLQDHRQQQRERRMTIILLAAAKQWLEENGVVLPSSQQEEEIITCNPTNKEFNGNSSGSPPMLLFMPLDIWTQISSFLHPKDVVTVSMVNSILQKFIVCNEVLWYMLWERDYFILVSSWDIGRRVLQQSLPWNCPAILQTHLQSLLPSSIATDATSATSKSVSMMEFYFQFGESWMNHFLAGYTGGGNRKCLTGLHGHVFDITHFMHSHPGSLETLIVHAGGKDASQFFEDVGHSKAARRMANAHLLSVFNPSTTVSTTDAATNRSTVLKLNAINQEVLALPMARQSKPIRSGTLYRIRQKHSKEQQMVSARQTAETQYDVLGHMNIYFDAFRGKWYSWYLNMDMEPIFHPQPLLP